MVESFVGTGATGVFASVGQQDDRAALFRSLGQIVGRAQYRIIECRHHLGAETKNPRRKIAPGREVLYLLDLTIEIVNGGDVFLAQTVEKANRSCSTQGETCLHAAGRIQ